MRTSSQNTPERRAVERLDALAAEHGLDASQRGQLMRLLSVLARDPHAPTAVSVPEDAVDVHVADSLSALTLDTVREARTIADLGSGAGLPGLVLAVALPSAGVWLVESQSRKCAFIEAAAAAIGLENARFVCARAEDWREGAGACDVVLARALAPQPVVVEYAAPLLRMRGSLVDWRGIRVRADEEAAARAATEVGLRRTAILAVRPFPAARDHHLHVFEKIADTPPRFPRRPGIARKRPLGA